jgi:hypothetical protein
MTLSQKLRKKLFIRAGVSITKSFFEEYFRMSVQERDELWALKNLFDSDPDSTIYEAEVDGEDLSREEVIQRIQAMQRPVCKAPLAALLKDLTSVKYEGKEEDYLGKLTRVIEALNRIEPQMMTANYGLMHAIADIFDDCADEIIQIACMPARYSLEREVSVAESELLGEQLSRPLNVSRSLYESAKSLLVDAGNTYLSICKKCPLVERAASTPNTEVPSVTREGPDKE